MRRGLLLAALLASPAGALEPMDGAAFRAFSEGWTLHFSDESGAYFGTEQYFEDGRTIWAPSGGGCHHGIWAEDAGRICFLYDVGLSCWKLFSEGEDSILAESVETGPGGGPPTRLRLMRKDRSAAPCDEGPGV
ncbi:MAG: hypothetical protein ACE37J_04275 [Pikeienuella sp.]|uniref:hypothetical protein n=1 Tax=Pikeienuella sp. TaxID=2831957 RepID=UPI00391C8256